ncbi:MAG: hypothetical protein SFW63_01860 [Alphaproteobacteria bacterium]|nr:hypothetical protein [Alphaproteobacteria bacterium]
MSFDMPKLSPAELMMNFSETSASIEGGTQVSAGQVAGGIDTQQSFAQMIGASRNNSKDLGI